VANDKLILYIILKGLVPI